MNTDTQNTAAQYTYEAFILRDFWQRLPTRTFKTLESAEKERERELSYGNKCYAIEVLNGR